MSILQLSNLRVHTLNPLNLKFNNEFVCVSGASGSGKSLLLRAIADLIDHEGDVFVDKIKCADVSPVQWRKWVGLLPAESAWWLDKVGDHFINETSKYCEQLNLPTACMNWDVSRCSTGERQRLAVARLLENKPKVLLLDEPTASLDPVSVTAVESLIKRYAKEFQAPVIWVSHDESQIKRIANREFKIENNKVKEVML